MGTFFTNKKRNNEYQQTLVDQKGLSEQTNELLSKQTNHKKEELVVKIENASKQRSHHNSTNKKDSQFVNHNKRILELIRRDFSTLEKVLNNIYQEIHKLDRSFRTKMISYIQESKKRTATKIRAFKTTLIPHKSNFTNQIEIAPHIKVEMENILPVTKIKMEQTNEERSKLGLMKNLFKQLFSRLFYPNSQEIRNQVRSKLIVAKKQQEKYEKKQELLTMKQILERTPSRNETSEQLFSRSTQKVENAKEEKLARISEKIQRARTFKNYMDYLGKAHVGRQL